MMEFNNNLVIPNLENSWLSGITDAEGCFSAVLSSSSNGFGFSFTMAQKWEENRIVLDTLAILLNARVYSHHQEDVYELRTSSLTGMGSIFKYFDTHPLMTKKMLSYIIWREVHQSLINGEHLSRESREKLKILTLNINPKL